MDTDHADLSDRLDRSIGTPPDAPDPLHAVLAHGRRTVRRRRVGGALGSAAAVLVVAGGAALATSGGEPDRAAPPVADSPTVEPTTPAPLPESLVRWDLGCELVVDSSATVVEKVDDPYGVSPPAASFALVVRDAAGETTWWAAYCSDQGSSALLTPEAKARGTFESWVAERADSVAAVEAGPPAQGQPADDLVRFVGQTEELATLDGATILEQEAAVDVGPDFAGSGDRTAAARIRTAKGDEVFVLVRAAAGEPSQAISVPVGAVAGDSLEEFLTFARDAYAGGGGLL